MNFFEGELHRMFSGNDIIHDPKIVGRTLLGKIDDDLRVKLQFVSTEVHKHYDAIQVSILNRTDGLVDRETMLFGDIIGVKNTNISGRVNPYMWEEGVGKAYWYTPVTASDKALIADNRPRLRGDVPIRRDGNVPMRNSQTRWTFGKNRGMLLCRKEAAT